LVISYFYDQIKHFENMRKQIVFILLVAFTTGQFSCSRSINKNSSGTENNKVDEELSVNVAAGPSVIIYKTSEDYFDKVPVTLSEDKSNVVSYPGIKDIYYQGEFSYPTRLNNGFLCTG